MKNYERYIERHDLKGSTHIEVSVYYSKGGVSFYNGDTIPRGYYLSVKPVKKGNNMISYAMFSGHSKLLFETQRYTAKQFDRAIEMAKDFEDELVSTVVEKNRAA